MFIGIISTNLYRKKGRQVDTNTKTANGQMKRTKVCSSMRDVYLSGREQLTQVGLILGETMRKPGTDGWLDGDDWGLLKGRLM